jgi:hypothetical protein
MMKMHLLIFLRPLKLTVYSLKIRRVSVEYRNVLTSGFTLLEIY